MRTAGFRSKWRLAVPSQRALVAVVLLGLWAVPGWGAPPMTLTFEPHGTFFSTETHQPEAIDPQVFVKVPGMAGVGPQKIEHVMGVMPAHLTDPANTPLYTARGKPLNVTLGQWLSAHGTVTIVPMGSHAEKLTASFAGLISRGSYSLFAVTFQPSGNTFRPLDGMGKSNNFAASATGIGSVTVTTPTMLTHANAVLLVYHSDGRAHGMSRGALGVTAHHQLIARVP